MEALFTSAPWICECVYMCCCSVTQLCLTLQPHGLQMPGLSVSHYLTKFAKFMSTASVIPSSHLWHPLPLQPSIFPSTREFSNESAVCIKWPKYWSFSFSISPSNEYSGLISLKITWLDLLAFQGTLMSLLQHHSSKASVLRHSAFLQSSCHSHMWPLGRP